MTNKKNKRKVLIGTPCYDGKLEAWHVNSLINTIKMSYEKDIDIVTIWVSYDALVQRARNDTVAYALDLDCDDLIFIDSDIEWEPQAFFKILECEEDVVGITYPKKTDTEEQFPILGPVNNFEIEKNGLIEVYGLGCGFLKFSRKALDYLWETSQEYQEFDKPNIVKKLVFHTGIDENKNLVSEDLIACVKLRQGNFKIWVDPSFTCNHVGVKKYVNSFENYLNRIKGQPTDTPMKVIDDDTIV